MLIEDDQDITELLTTYLAKFDMEVTAFLEPQLALQNLDIDRYDLIILDLTLPFIDGLEVCKKIRQKTTIPIIISSARTDLTDKVIGLENGADDYLPKPYEPRELVARIKAQIRRYTKSSNGQKSIFEMDTQNFCIYKRGEKITLTLAEFEIFQMLFERRGSVVSRDYIANNINAINWQSSERSIDVLISRIRKKIDETNDNESSYIKSIRGVGYRLQ